VNSFMRGGCIGSLVFSGFLLNSASAQPLALTTAPALAPAVPSQHGFQTGAPPQDMSGPDASVPRGEILVEVVGGDEQPLRAVEVQLNTQFESIAQGKRQDEQKVGSDAAGQAVFRGLDASLRFSYAVRVAHQGATYEVPAFRLPETSGQRVRLHVYPVTHDLQEAFVGMRGFVLIDLRDGAFHFDVVYRVMNMSHTTWMPRELRIALPREATGLELTNEANQQGFVDKGGSVELVGTYPPGQKDVRLQFQVPALGDEDQAFVLGTPPHLAELRVLVEAIPGMHLDVPGFDAAEPTRGPDGKRILITRRLMRPGQGQLDEVRIELSGLPVPGPGRLVACALGLLIAALGITQASVLSKKTRLLEAQEDRGQARRILLGELVALEQAFASAAVGPKTHEQAKRQLLDALARLEVDSPSPVVDSPSPVAG